MFLARNGLGFALFLGKRSQLFVFLGAMSELHEKQAEKVQIFLINFQNIESHLLSSQRSIKDVECRYNWFIYAPLYSLKQIC